MNLRQSNILNQQGNTPPFTEGELDTMAHELMLSEGPNLFWSKLDIYLPGGPGEKKPSALYWEIKGNNLNSNRKDPIFETLRLLNARPNSSRAAFGSALVAANRCSLAEKLGIRNAVAAAPIAAPAVIVDKTPLNFDECLKLANKLLQHGGPMTFIIKANTEFPAKPGERSVSELWSQVTTRLRGSYQEDPLIELCMQLSQQDNWSRAALGRALTAAGRTPLATDMGFLNPATAVAAPAAATPAPVAAPALIGDTEPLKDDECLKLATELLEQRGRLTFLVKANEVFRTKTKPREEPISDLWNDIKATLRGTERDQLFELCKQMSGRGNWSRAALGRALTASDRTPLAEEMGFISPATTDQPMVQTLASTARLFTTHTVTIDNDKKPLTYAETLRLATPLSQHAGPVGFIDQADVVFGSRDNPRPVSNKWKEIQAENRSSTKDQLMVLLDRLGGIPNWSRDALRLALMEANLANIALQNLQSEPPPRDKMTMEFSDAYKIAHELASKKQDLLPFMTALNNAFAKQNDRSPATDIWAELNRIKSKREWSLEEQLIELLHRLSGYTTWSRNALGKALIDTGHDALAEKLDLAASRKRVAANH